MRSACVAHTIAAVYAARLKAVHVAAVRTTLTCAQLWGVRTHYAHPHYRRHRRSDLQIFPDRAPLGVNGAASGLVVPQRIQRLWGQPVRVRQVLACSTRDSQSGSGKSWPAAQGTASPGQASAGLQHKGQPVRVRQVLACSTANARAPRAAICSYDAKHARGWCAGACRGRCRQGRGVLDSLPCC